MRNGGVIEGAADVDDVLRTAARDALHGVGEQLAGKAMASGCRGGWADGVASCWHRDVWRRADECWQRTKVNGYGRNRRRDDVLEENDLGIEVMGVATERVKLGSYGRCGVRWRAGSTDLSYARCHESDEWLGLPIGALAGGGYR
ncbi:hypothetical protein ACLOJK_019526 [Asimina triloba]